MLSHTTILVGSSIFVLYVIHKYLDFRRTVQSIQDHPGYRTLFTIVTPFLPKYIRGICPGNFTGWLRKHGEFEEIGWDIASAVNALPEARVVMMLADPAAIKEVTSSRARFPKPLEPYKVLSFFGSNIVVTEGDEWKRQRKIAAPAFSERNNRLVWDESVNIVLDLFENVWGTQDNITVNHIVDLTVPIALFVIGIAGFGQRATWKGDQVIPAGYSMTFKDALHEVSTRVHMKLILPDWVLNWGPTETIRHFKLAYDNLERYIVEMVQARKTAEKKEERYDLFSSLLDANEEESEGQMKLSDSELVGNIFIFLIAGHEVGNYYTSIILYQHIKSVLPDGRRPNYEDMGSLTYSMAVFNETLRMFPPVTSIPKSSAEDTTLVTSNAAGEKLTVPIPKGTYITIHTPGLHYNPRYWEDPHVFKPSRFLGDWPRDAFLPFSGGPRACVGRRFSETEAVAILSLIVLRYKVEVKEEPQFAGETFEQQKERLLKCGNSITIYPKHPALPRCAIVIHFIRRLLPEVWSRVITALGAIPYVVPLRAADTIACGPAIGEIGRKTRNSGCRGCAYSHIAVKLQHGEARRVSAEGWPIAQMLRYREISDLYDPNDSPSEEGNELMGNDGGNEASDAEQLADPDVSEHSSYLHVDIDSVEHPLFGIAFAMDPDYDSRTEHDETEGYERILAALQAGSLETPNVELLDVSILRPL
ncbi:hypothetical protein A0H81_12320 [Grifola frondosa]|uniref:Cytochrome P450 n=1 Tax=Grifola frondosa TaxID=5627 RepID=A0A1C7LYD6_GRIFR|nr:hypothetical protein A0H81_12320 [Grifola frondosa]